MLLLSLYKANHPQTFLQPVFDPLHPYSVSRRPPSLNCCRHAEEIAMLKILIFKSSHEEEDSEEQDEGYLYYIQKWGPVCVWKSRRFRVNVVETWMGIEWLLVIWEKWESGAVRRVAIWKLIASRWRHRWVTHIPFTTPCFNSSLAYDHWYIITSSLPFWQPTTKINSALDLCLRALSPPHENLETTRSSRCSDNKLSSLSNITNVVLLHFLGAGFHWKSFLVSDRQSFAVVNNSFCCQPPSCSCLNAIFSLAPHNPWGIPLSTPEQHTAHHLVKIRVL